MTGTDARPGALETHMRRALALAERGGGATAPNPMVGCVLVAGDGRVVGEGYHRRAGGPHAEVVALEAARSAGHDPADATAVVTLEPCNAHHRTPPCTIALLEAGVAEVVYAISDPHIGKGGADGEWNDQEGHDGAGEEQQRQEQAEPDGGLDVADVLQRADRRDQRGERDVERNGT